MTRFSIPDAMRLANEYERAGKYAQAEQVCRQILAVAPANALALHLAGVAALNSGRAAEAVDLISRAITLEPHEGYFYYNFGLANVRAGNFEKATIAFRQAIAIRPNLAEAHGNLAAALLCLHKPQETIEACRQAIALHAETPQIFNALGVGLKHTGKIDEAIAAFERALDMRPDFFESLTNLAHVLRNKGRFKESISLYRRALALRPNQPELHNNLANTLEEDGDMEAAIDEFRRAISLKPRYPEAECSLASTLHRAGRFEEAIAACRNAIAHSDDPLARFNLALMLLLQGEYEEGWKLFEARWNVRQFRGERVNFAKPKWDGSDLKGQTILLYSEQGFGDTIQFVRYLPLVRERGGRIILGPQPELVRLLKQMKEPDLVVAEHDSSLKYDVHYPLLSLPLLFNTTLATIPKSIPYLTADPTLVSTWQARMPADRFKVGLTWAGRTTHPYDRQRNAPLSALAPLAEVGNAWFCSLQKGEAAKQAQESPANFEVADFSEQIEDFADVAAIIANLDLVITVDTAAAHLAGAMGKPVWVMLSTVPDWRWMLERNDSPWYPTMKLFRQTSPGDWQSVIENVKRALSLLTISS